MACTIGAVACLPFAQRLIEETGTAAPGARAALVYLGLGPTAIAFTTWAYALSHMNAGRLGVTTYLVPPLTIVGAWIVLGEVPPGWAMVGGALCLVGVGLSRRKS